MRIFSALPLPADVKQKFSESCQGQLPAKFVYASNLHITLNFFGEVEAARLELLKELFKKVSYYQTALTIEFLKVVMFKDQVHATVKKTHELMAYQSALEKKFTSFGFEFQNKSYYPHVKLSNVVYGRDTNPDFVSTKLNSIQIADKIFLARKSVLYESRLLKSHARHIPIIELDLIA
jgi:2'-5' RNA ligase